MNSMIEKKLRPVQRGAAWASAKVLAVVSLAMAAAAANAAVDITAATTGVSDAQTALLSLLGAFMGLSAAIYGVVKVYRFLSKKSGG
jgi:shikimate kinase